MSESPGWHTRGCLPHFANGQAIQIVTFRLADSLPTEVLAKLDEQALDEITRRAAIERCLDQGMGSSLVRDPAHAAAACGALLERDGRDYRLRAWVIMPNHVHTLVEPLAGVTIGKIVRAWKSVSARRILGISPGSADALVRNRPNADEGVRAPGKEGVATTQISRRLWQPDYFDRCIRDERHYRAAVEYIHQNPVVARLVALPIHWPWSSAAPLAFTSTRTAPGTSRPSRCPPARAR